MPQFRYAKELHVTDVFADVTFGSTGAPTMKALNSLGVKSVVRNSAGNYTVSFIQPHVRLLSLNQTYLSTAPAAAVMSVTSVTNVGNAKTPSMIIQFQNSSGTATDPASGEEVLLAFVFSGSVAA